ncbi:MAG: hypothetical protein ABI761_12495 [Saprospiraceae bacterium]
MKGIAKIICILAVVISACTSTEIPKQVKELVDIRMKIFRANQDSICRVTATKRAELAVDSFFLSFKKQYLLDSIHIPEKPIKPLVDTHLILNNTLPVKPFWDSLSIKKNQ